MSRRFRYDDVDIYSGWSLPHWDVPNGIYFVTFCLADAVPPHCGTRAWQSYRREVRDFVDSGDPKSEEIETCRFDAYTEHVDPRLDEHRGDCVLASRENAEVVRDALRYFDGERYDLFTWTVMPNHVHVLFQIGPDEGLGDVVHSWKSYTANEIDWTSPDGAVWQLDYFDRLVRDEREFRRVAEYVVDNPVEAGLEEWPWVGQHNGWRPLGETGSV